MRFVLASKNPGKLPIVDTVRAILAEQVAPKLHEGKDQMEQGNGSNLTTRQDTAYFNIEDDDGKPAGRIMISWSANYWDPKVEGEKSTRGARNEDDRITLTSKEFQQLDAAITTLKQGGDFDNAVKLATIKSIAQSQGNKVSREDFRVVSALGQQ